MAMVEQGAWGVGSLRHHLCGQATVRRVAHYGAAVFAWAGGTEVKEPHYYRVQGPTFILEYANTQNGANHVHAVWRDFNGDFGNDVLGEHFAKHHKAE